MEEFDLLKRIGLTDSETKVYLSLLRMGSMHTKTRIVKESKTSASKVYEILDKLMDKGLVSIIIKNNVRHYAAAPPSKIHTYLEHKKTQIEEEERLIKQLLPQLQHQYANVDKNTTAELFLGWKGLETVYSTMTETLKKSDEICILGASAGTAPEKTKRFFGKYAARAARKNLSIRALFNEDARSYIREMEQEYVFSISKRFMQKTTPVEILITRERIVIVILKDEPLAIVVKDVATAKSFKTYFDELWAIARE